MNGDLKYEWGDLVSVPLLVVTAVLLIIVLVGMVCIVAGLSSRQRTKVVLLFVVGSGLILAIRVLHDGFD
jgi:hypothetical protein